MVSQLENKFKTLSQRELVILEMIASGQSSRGIAEKLSVSERTIEKHRSSIIRKFGLVGSTNSLAKFVILNSEWLKTQF